MCKGAGIEEGGCGSLPKIRPGSVFSFRTEVFGLMAEWLGKGLQNLVQRFESASDLTKTALQVIAALFFYT